MFHHNVLRFRRVILLVSALSLALVTNYLFTGEIFHRTREMAPGQWANPQKLACVVLAIAVALAAIALGKWSNFVTSDEGCPAQAPNETPPRWIHFVPTAVLYLACTAAYLFGGESATVHWLWFLSVGALLWPLRRAFDHRDFWPIPFWEYALLGLITLVAFITRYLDLVDVPYHVDNDVSIMGLFSQKLIAESDWHWIGMAPTDHQYSEHQLLALSMRLFGLDHYGLVMLSVVAGTATVTLLYYLGKLLFNRWVGFLGAAILALNYVHIHFSRIVFGPLSTFFVVLSGVFLVHGIRRRSPLSFAIGGGAVGLGLLCYYSGRVGPIFALCLFILAWANSKHFTRSVNAESALKPNENRFPAYYWWFAVAGLITIFGPNLSYSLSHLESFHGRGNTVIIWSGNAWHYLGEKYQSSGNAYHILSEQIKRTFLTPFYFPDESIICYLRRPMLGIFAVVGFTLGIGYCIRRFRDLACGYILLWFAVTFVLGGVLTIDPPYWPHLNVALPAISLIAAVGIERFVSQVTLIPYARVRTFGIGLVVATLIGSGIQDWDVYYRFASVHATGPVHAMRQIEKLPPNYKVYFVSKSTLWSQATFQFMTPQADGRNISEAELYKKIPKIDRPTVFFVFEDADQKCIDYLISAFPWSARRLYRDGWLWPVFTMIRVLPPGYVETPQAHQKPDKMFWSMSGGQCLIGILVGVAFIGCATLRHELRERQKLFGDHSPRLNGMPEFESRSADSVESLSDVKVS